MSIKALGPRADLSCLDQVQSQVAFAVVVGVSAPAVSQLVARGVLRSGAPLREWLLAYTKHLRAMAAGRPENDEEAGGELTRARTREANAKAHMAEIDAAERLRALVPAGEVEVAMRNWAARGSLAIDSAARAIVEGLRSEFGITVEDRHVRDHLRAAQRDIAAYAADLGETAESGGLGVAPAGADADRAVCRAESLPGAGDQ